MKRLFRFLTLTVLLSVGGCQMDYDDSELVGRIDNLESRVERLEQLCQQMNNNISSLQAIVNALQMEDYITDVAPIIENGITIGYTISFAKAQSITIYHGEDGKDGADGKDGKDGYTPQIGVKQDSDGIYYWTLDGEWLLDGNGNKISVIGTDGADGKDGSTPQLKIENDYWYVSYDNGASWIQLGKATGEDGQDGTNGVDGKDGVDGSDGKDGDSFFQSISQDENNVYFTLADGTVITVPKGLALSVKFEESDLVVMSPNSTREIGYTVTSLIDPVKVEVTSSADIKAKVVAEDESGLTGKIHVITGDAIDEYSKVIVFVSNGDRVIMRSIAFEKAGLVVADNAIKQASADGGEVTLEFLSNVECQVVIPGEAQDWISVVPATRAMEKQTITLKLEPNEGYYRSATVTVQSPDGTLKLEYQVEQDGDLNEIWYTTTDGQIITLSDPNVFGVTIVSNEYDNSLGKGIIKFEEKVTEIGYGAFEFCENLQSMTIPNDVTSIGQHAFRQCMNLQNVTLPKNLKSIGHSAFNCTDLRSIIIPNGVEELGDCVFRETGLVSITIPESVNNIGVGLLTMCPLLKEIKGKFASDDGRCLIVNGTLNSFAPNGLIEYVIPSSVTKIGFNVFRYSNLKNITIPNGVTSIGEMAFMNCENLQSITIPENVCEIGNYAFSSCFGLKEFKGKFSSDDGRSLVIDRVLEYVAPSLLVNYTIPNNVTKIADSAFSGCENLQSIIIPENVVEIGVGVFSHCPQLRNVSIGNGVTSIGQTAFYYCESLQRITFPKSITFMGSHILCGCQNLKEIYCRAITPPEGNEYMFLENSVGRKIYVPTESVQTYRTAPYWEDYALYIVGYDFSDSIVPDYISTDYSQDGKVTALQTATVGDGIDIVLMGDAYSDRQIENGTYKTDMEYIYSNLFTQEPYKSFKDHFNVYYVNVVSATEGYEYGNTTLDGYFGDGTLVGGNDNTVFNYALNAISEHNMDEALIIVAMNSDNYAGTCYMYYPTYTTGTYGSGPSVAYFPKGGDATTFAQLLHHEACGHGFAKLADEYAYDYMGTIPSDYVSEIQSQQADWGWWKNVDFTNDPTSIRWSRFINDSRYANEAVGAYEGGLTYWSGVWRPTENSIMRYNTGGFNAPSREAIYYRIHKLAYGDSWEYDYEEFVKWDARNRAEAPRRSAARKPANYRPTHPPVIMNKTWKDAR